MKVLSLNTWGGEAGIGPLLTFLSSQKEVDVFCLQEVWNGGEHMLEKKSGGSWLEKRIPTLLPQIREVLPEYIDLYHPHFHDFFGLATFVRKGIPIIEEGEHYIYKEKGFVSPEEFGDHARILHYVVLDTEQGPQTIVQLHGLWNGKGKEDSEERLEQSQRIVSFLKGRKEPIVLLGDFNLSPHTESVRMIESAGMRNLIQEYGITSTRTVHYTKENKFADYAFVSEGIEVRDFVVLPDAVSDHAPLLLDFSLA
jgi:endonuclease/exonuclease/phosphatase (EEP) superfamily protein YafD